MKVLKRMGWDTGGRPPHRPGERWLLRGNGRSALASWSSVVIWGVAGWGMLAANEGAFAQTDTTWNGGASNWNNAANWSGGFAPNNGNGFTNWNVFIDGGDAGDSTVSLDINSTINQLNISANDSLDILDNRTLSISQGGQAGSGIINNDGAISLTSGGNLTSLSLSGTTSINGVGTITLVGNSTSTRITGFGTMTHGAGHTIQGSGNLGNNVLSIVNQGVVQAGAGAALVIDPSNLGGGTQSFINNGTVQAFDGGVITLTGNGFGEFGGSGTYTADNGSTIDLTTGAIARNTTFSTIGTGEIRFGGGFDTATWENVTNTGNAEGRDNGTLNILSSLVNSGDIHLNGTGNVTQLSNSGATNISGGGTIRFTGGINTRFAGTGSVTNVDNTISGNGNLGTNGFEFINQGVVQAGFGESLIIDPRNNGSGVVAFDNQNLVRAFDGGLITLTGNGFGEFGGSGTYTAENGSRIDLIAGAIIRNTTFATSGTGEIRGVSGQSATWVDVTNTGNLVRNDNGTLNIQSSMINSGDVHLNGTGNFTLLTNTGVTSISGGGTIRLTGGSNTRIDGSGSVTNVDNTISGTGNLGFNGIEFINQGVVQAGSGESLTIDPRNNGAGVVAFDNQNLVRAFDGGLITLTGNGFGEFGGNGIYIAEDGSRIDLVAEAVARNTTFVTSGSGEIRVVSGQNATWVDVTNAGNLVRNDNGILNIQSSLFNSGDIHLNGAGNLTLLSSTGVTTISGGGTIRLTGSFGNTRITGSGTLTNADNTISGTGNFGANGLAIINQGIVQAGAGEALTVDPTNAGAGVAAFENQGTVRAENAGVVTMTGNGNGEFGGSGTFEALDGGSIVFDSVANVQNIDGGELNSGTWRAIDNGAGANIRVQNDNTSLINKIGSTAAVELSGANSSFTVRSGNVAIDSSLNEIEGSLTLRNGRTMNLSGSLLSSGATVLDGAATVLSVAGDYTQTSGSLSLLDGATLELAGTLSDIQGGLVEGNGFINGDIINSGGLVTPGNSAGLLSVNGDYFQGAGGGLTIEIGGLIAGSDFDQLQVSGDVNLDGTLFVELLNAFSPLASESFTILTGNSVSGNFANAMTSVAVLGGGSFDVTYTGNSIVLSNFTAVPEPSAVGLLSLVALTLAGYRRRRDD